MKEYTLDSKKVISQGLQFLSKKDKKLAKIFNPNTEISFKKRDSGFKALLKIIISQQLSTSAANSIWKRFIDNNIVSRSKILSSSDQTLLSLGLSKQKCSYVKGLAIQDINYDDLATMTSIEVINRLMEVKGIGRWTAEIYCMFSLGKANVFPSGDLALQESIKLVFGFQQRPSEKETLKFSDNWDPWKSLAAHLLWDYYRKIKNRG